jgi:hypothetical protein
MKIAALRRSFYIYTSPAVLPSCSCGGLEPGCGPRLAWVVAGVIFVVKVREHDFMREERRPFNGFGAVGVVAADKLVQAVGLADQFGVAEMADDLAAVALRDDVFQFHTQPRYAMGWDNGCPCEKIYGGNQVARKRRSSYDLSDFMPAPVNHPRDPLHGITLENILNQLVQHHGWEEMARRIPIRCFQFDPSVKSSLTFLRKTPWARKKVENWFILDLGQK